MPDDLTNRGRPDRDRINVNEDHELRNWAHKFGISTDELKEAVKAVGDRAKAVKEHLAGRAQGLR
jgi:hypothetical protein